MKSLGVSVLSGPKLRFRHTTTLTLDRQILLLFWKVPWSVFPPVHVTG